MLFTKYVKKSILYKWNVTEAKKILEKKLEKKQNSNPVRLHLPFHNGLQYEPDGCGLYGKGDGIQL